ncbi:MAG: Crp/Fnr family transcriptional regulator [Monoglobales bacterium]
MEQYLSLMRNSSIFMGMNDDEIRSILKCLDAKKIDYAKGDYILRVGTSTEHMGLLLSGAVLIIQEDIWGRRSIMDMISPGDFFAEHFAASAGSVLSVSVVADSDCSVMMLNINHILSNCPTACSHHSQVIRNLVSTLARKTLRFNNKITHMSKRSTRDKLLSFLSSEAIRNNSLSFTIPYDRQKLADYLCVERAAMSVALSALQKEGLLSYKKNRFVLHTNIDDKI